MKTELVGIKWNGIYHVAVFREGSGSFALNIENLRMRITNMKKDGRDFSTENAALAELLHRTRTESTKHQS